MSIQLTIGVTWAGTPVGFVTDTVQLPGDGPGELEITIKLGLPSMKPPPVAKSPALHDAVNNVGGAFAAIGLTIPSGL